MKCYIYLFRHGETYYNLGGIGKNKKFTGWKDSKLSPKGIKSANKIARKLKNIKFQIAFQTRLSRSKDTLKEVLKYHPECKKIINDDRMIERNYGTLQGHTHKAIIKKYGMEKFRQWHRSYDIAPPKGESIKMVEKRVKSFIKDLLKLIKKEKVNVVISAHGNSMRPFRRYFEKLNIKEMISLENPYDDYFRYSVNV
ncbi:MAG: 2,3-bisphosphoglycerate-dependent phosphoglycerate mutase [Nanoarchaeota archaeon]|nr:2,3-bisphosphoglycerate-dependent phosphoglycerate mutase [Nanoarchaeota archaeon]